MRLDKTGAGWQSGDLPATPPQPCPQIVGKVTLEELDELFEKLSAVQAANRAAHKDGEEGRRTTLHVLYLLLSAVVVIISAQTLLGNGRGSTDEGTLAEVLTIAVIVLT